MHRIVAVFLALAATLVAPSTAGAGPSAELPSTRPAGAETIVVDARRGRDSNPGTATRPLKTVAAAWARIPQARALDRPVRVLVRPGRYSARALPNYWESRWGTRTAPIVIAAARPGTVTFGAVNLYDLHWVAFSGIAFRDRFDLFHCEECRHVLLTRSRLVGSPNQLHENVKVNQSEHVGITDSVVSGAEDNAIDFVAVQHATVTGNVIERAGDWCMYAKGGSAFVTVAGNRIRHCGTGGFTAGQGTGLQFMTAPFIRYEAYGIHVLDNQISDTDGAGVGVNGGYNVVIARNQLWDVGVRSHLIEIGYGARSCDGQPGDDGREACQANLDAGGWGTTEVDDGTNYTRIPNRHVWVLGNVVDNPRRQGDQLFDIAAPWTSDVRADDDLHVTGNVIAGRGLPAGTDECAADDCAALAERNELGAAPGLFRDPVHGDLRLSGGRAMPSVELPDFDWADSGGVSP